VKKLDNIGHNGGWSLRKIVRARQAGDVSFCWFSHRIVNICSSLSIERYMDVNHGMINGRVKTGTQFKDIDFLFVDW
jgi:hypothetical protein